MTFPLIARRTSGEYIRLISYFNNKRFRRRFDELLNQELVYLTSENDFWKNHQEKEIRIEDTYSINA